MFCGRSEHLCMQPKMCHVAACCLCITTNKKKGRSYTWSSPEKHKTIIYTSMRYWNKNFASLVVHYSAFFLRIWRPSILSIFDNNNHSYLVQLLLLLLVCIIINMCFSKLIWYKQKENKQKNLKLVAFLTWNHLCIKTDSKYP